MNTDTTLNPFLSPYNTTYQVVPFDAITLAHYEPAVMEGIRIEELEIDEIANNPEPPTFENTIVALAKPDGVLGRATSVFFNLLNAETCDEMDELAQKLSPILSEHSNNIMLNEKLFARVKAVYQNPPTLTSEERMLLEKSYEGFERSGANLDPAGKEKLRHLTKELSKLTLQFSQNNLKESNEYTLHLLKEEDLKGLPQTAIEAAALAAKERELSGWVFTLDAPSYSPFITYADNRELREQLYRSRNTLGIRENEYNNEQIVKQIVNLRRELAQLMGYKSYADFVLTKRMAQNSENVYKLLHDLLEAYTPTAQKEVAEITEMARKMTSPHFILAPWDFAYYAHKLQLEKYNLDAEMLRPYFQLNKVIEGVFNLAERLYGIRFVSNLSLPVYHPDVTAYEVYDKDNSFLAVLYADFHPRKSKQSGAWMTDFKGQWIEEGVNSRPHISVTMNFTKPTESKPALLTLGEVETFLHEFGHALHGIFANTRFPGLSGTNVYWDFVELPSQIMENFAIERDFLNTFAFHYETGEPLPDELIERIIKSRNYNVAYSCLRQVSFGLLDMAYYTLTTPFDEDVKSFEKRAWAPAQLLPQLEDTCMSVQFSHIMAGGYSAGYYSYKWAEVLDADAFSLFKEKGIFNQEVANSFREHILSKGGTELPMELYTRFRKQEPTIDALLKRNGITSN